MLCRVNPGDAVGPESWSSRYILDFLRKNALKCRPITSLEAIFYISFNNHFLLGRPCLPDLPYRVKDQITDTLSVDADITFTWWKNFGGS